MQEMKRRYASIYIPDETIDDQFNEHCGVCDEQGIEEAVLADRDYKYDGKVIKYVVLKNVLPFNMSIFNRPGVAGAVL